jgi:RNA-binding protein
MSSKPIHNISIRAICSATESEEKVKKALSTFIFENKTDIINTDGHFGNPISILTATIRGIDCNRFIELLISMLPEQDMHKLKDEIYDRVDDDCVLHLRLDKQAAYDGNVQIATTGDTITSEIKLRTYPARREKAITVAENIFRTKPLSLADTFTGATPIVKPRI